jgi:hypothetical protein
MCNLTVGPVTDCTTHMRASPVTDIKSVLTTICGFVKRLLHTLRRSTMYRKGKDVPLYAMEALGGKGGIAPTHT